MWRNFGEMIYLFDMDNTVVDFDKGILDAFEKTYEIPSPITIDGRKHFKIKDDFPKELQHLVDPLYKKERFFANLKPLHGAVDTLHLLQASPCNEVFLCTTPLRKNKHCVPEKYEWISNNLGYDWTRRIICSKDKTVVRGDYLIDDKVDVSGILKPSWNHYLFDRPYNRTEGDKKRVTWETIQEEFING